MTHDIMDDAMAKISDLEAENEQLRELVRESYSEGYWDGIDGARISNADNDGWLKSLVRKALRKPKEAGE